MLVGEKIGIRNFRNVENMNYEMIKRWNNAVSNKDKVYHLGDFCMGNKQQTTEIVSQLNGEITLVKGNHSKKSNKWYRECGFDSVIDGGLFLEDKYILTHKPLEFVSSPYYNISGHTHTYNTPNPRVFNVSVEQINYTPILFEKVKKILSERNIK